MPPRDNDQENPDGDSDCSESIVPSIPNIYRGPIENLTVILSDKAINAHYEISNCMRSIYAPGQVDVSKDWANYRMQIAEDPSILGESLKALIEAMPANSNLILKDLPTQNFLTIRNGSVIDFKLAYQALYLGRLQLYQLNQLKEMVSYKIEEHPEYIKLQKLLSDKFFYDLEQTWNSLFRYVRMAIQNTS